MTASVDTLSMDDLPPRLAALAQRLGLAATLRLVEARGGTRVYVPETVNEEHWLARLLGREAMAALVTLHGREFVDIDRGAGALRAARDRHIVARSRAGQSSMTLALQYHLTQRQVFNILARAPTGNDAQSDLFRPLAD